MSAEERIAAFRAISEERVYQDMKYGRDGHSVGAWLLIMMKELDEAIEACIKPAEGRNNVISEIIQVAATAVACLEQYGVDPIEGRKV